MRLKDILRAVAELTAEERRQLSDYLDRVPEKSPRLSPEEKMQRLKALLDASGEGLSSAELDELKKRTPRHIHTRRFRPVEYVA